MCGAPEYDYTGTVHTTRDGIECQRWDSQVPHEHWLGEIVTDAANYCRNPIMMDGGPFCITMDPNVEWDYCCV